MFDSVESGLRTQGATAAGRHDKLEAPEAAPPVAVFDPMAAAQPPVPTARVLRLVPGPSGTAQGGLQAFADSDINTGSPRPNSAQDVPFQLAPKQPGRSPDTTPSKQHPVIQGSEMQQPATADARSSRSELFPLPSLVSRGGLETPPSVSRPSTGADLLPEWARDRVLQPSPPKPPVLLYTAGFGKSSSSEGTPSEGGTVQQTQSQISDATTAGLASPIEVGVSRSATSQTASASPRFRPVGEAHGGHRAGAARGSVLALEAIASSGIPLSPSPQKKAEGTSRQAQSPAVPPQRGTGRTAQESHMRTGHAQPPKLNTLELAQAHNHVPPNEAPLGVLEVPGSGERQGEGRAGAANAVGRGEAAARHRNGPGGVRPPGTVRLEDDEPVRSADHVRLVGHPGVDPRISLSGTLTIPGGAQDGTKDPTRNPPDRSEGSLSRSQRLSGPIDMPEARGTTASVFDALPAHASHVTSPPTPVLFRCKSAPRPGSRGVCGAPSRDDHIASDAAGAVPSRLFEETSSCVGGSALTRSVSAMGLSHTQLPSMRTSVSPSEIFSSGPSPSGDQATVSESEPSFNVLVGSTYDSEATITAVTGEILGTSLLRSLHCATGSNSVGFLWDKAGRRGGYGAYLSHCMLL